MRTNRQKLITKLDILFSKKVREIGHCEKCFKETNLQCAHIFSRRHKWLRYELNNGLCLCAGCHLYWWHMNPAEAIRWAQQIRCFDELELIMKFTKPMKIMDLEEIESKLKE